MKKFVGYCLSWTLYALGDLVSRPMSRFDCMAWTYPIYNSLMIASGDIQDWSGCNGPWDNEPVNVYDLMAEAEAIEKKYSQK